MAVLMAYGSFPVRGRIWVPAANDAAGVAMPDPLTHCAGPGIQTWTSAAPQAAAVGFLSQYVTAGIPTMLFFFAFLEPHWWHMEVLRLRVELELQLSAYATAMATLDLSHVCDLHHSSWQHWIFNPQSEARGWTRILMDTSQVSHCCATVGTPQVHFFFFVFLLFLGPLLRHMGVPRLGVESEL